MALEETQKKLMEKRKANEQSKHNLKPVGTDFIKAASAARKISKSKSKNENFGMVFRSLIEHPAFGELNRRDRDILWILLACRHAYTGIAAPGHEYILKLLNLWRPERRRPLGIQSVTRGLASLSKKGFVQLVKDAYPGHYAEYFVAAKPEEIIAR
jgi:hypothetical protein